MMNNPFNRDWASGDKVSGIGIYFVVILYKILCLFLEKKGGLPVSIS